MNEHLLVVIGSVGSHSCEDKGKKEQYKDSSHTGAFLSVMLAFLHFQFSVWKKHKTMETNGNVFVHNKRNGSKPPSGF